MSAILAGVPFDGLERGWEMTIDRHIEVVDVIGSRPRLVPLFPTAATDEFELTCEFWADSTYAALMESSLPPRGISESSSLLVSAPLAAPPLERMLGRTGTIVITRLLGMLLAALSVQFVIDGIRGTGLI